MADDSGFGGFDDDGPKTGGDASGESSGANDGGHGHETDGCAFYYAASDATQSQDLSEAISVTEPESEPRRRRTVLTALNIRRPKLSIGDELLGPSPKGKVKLGQ